MTLPPAMTTTDVQRIFKILGAGNVRFVGGCVRNMLIGLPVGDIDLATTLTPDQVIKKLSAAKIKTVPTGIDHGTVTAVMDGVGYEITTLRRDVETDGRRAVVAYTNDWAEDAARRDFTMNALYADVDGNIFDPLEQGLKDIERRKIRFVGDAETRIQEDYLRILRFFRFHSLYGRGTLDRAGLRASAKFVPSIKTLSRERVTQELKKILMGNSPHKILSVMQAYNIIPDIIRKNFDADKLAKLIKFQNAIPDQSDDILYCTRLFMVFGTAKPKQIILSKKQTDIMTHLSCAKIDFKNADMRGILYTAPRASVIASLMIWAVENNIRLVAFKKYASAVTGTKIPVFPVQGKDLLARGMAEGAEIGKTLKRLEQKWIKSGFALDNKSLLN